MNEYQKKLEEFRFHYFTKYQVKLDDEILYFFIRVNEMQMDLKKDICSIPKLSFRSRLDYFFYGLGKYLFPSLLILAFFVTMIFIPYKNKIIIKNGEPKIEIKYNDTLYYISLKQP